MVKEDSINFELMPRANLGLLPLLSHCDGAEFYNNTEFVVWSVGSAWSEGHVWDIKFPIACVPHEAMVDPNVNDSEF